MIKALKHIAYINNPSIAYNISKGLFYRNILKKHVLRSVELAITYKCNASCDKCYSRFLVKNKEELSVQQINQIWKQCSSLGAFHINLTGCEPLLREDIFEIIVSLNPKKNIVSLVSNGSLLNKIVLNKLKLVGLNTLQISLDSADAILHNNERGIKELHKKVVTSIKHCKEIGLNVNISSVLYHNGFSEFLKIVSLAKKLDVFVLLNYAGCVGGWQNKNEKRLSKEEWVRSYELLKNPFVRS